MKTKTEKLHTPIFYDGKIVLGIFMTILLLFFSISGRSHALETPETPSITPSNTFATMELADRCTDVLLKARGIKDVKEVKLMEKGLRPMHVYQIAVATIDMIIEFEKKENMISIPKIVATPRQYLPADVERVGEMIVSEIRRIASILNIDDLPQTESHFENKVPTDVFGKLLNVFIKFSILAKMETITPNETYAQMVRIVSDVKSILTHIDSAQRYRIDAPVSPSGLTPGHVFKECLLMRQDINTLRKHFNMEVIPVPEIQADFQLQPSDVFIQTQIIIAECNLLKMGTGTVSSTPLPIPIRDKTPSDVHQQAAMARYLLSQVKLLQEMVGEKR